MVVPALGWVVPDFIAYRILRRDDGAPVCLAAATVAHACDEHVAKVLAGGGIGDRIAYSV